ncbi:class F sortase [Nocardioides sediminis]|uniref:class F sortase n=1 Tax=Nocardioides sediminis TaxID=433648 RepID=UPI001F3F074C|nr:class F sortase [Nocardioides sediminis]
MPAAVLSVMSLAGAAVIWAVEHPPVGTSSGSEVRTGSPAAPVTSRRAESEPATSASQGQRHRTARPRALPAAGVPRAVVVEALAIDVPVLPIESQGRALEPPSDPQVLGWWSDGARPGSVRGSALVTGHTVHDGGGALDDLETLRAGAVVRVRTDRGSIRYVVDSVRVLDKDTIARQAPQLFSQQVHGRLVLVTCEGWDGTGYRSNVVVTATPTS